MTKLHEINQLGQSIWNDSIRRSMLDNGEMQQLIDNGVTGVTSNPTIFEKAIIGSDDYNDELREMPDGSDAGGIYETLALSDIRRTADLLRPVYDRTDGVDGFISLEVSPALAHDTEGTIAEAQRLFDALDRPNVMIKIPATPEGIPAIAHSIGKGININVTLIFSLAQYEAVTEAYITGLERLDQAGGDVSRIASVASFFVSRVDTLVDKHLEERGNTALQGTIAVANAKMAYARFQQIFGTTRWQALANKGAHVQRPLWASTGTKNPNYPDTLYVDTLIGPHTVNTMPPATLQAVLDHATVASTLETGIDQAREQLAQLQDLGINMTDMTQKLQDDGVAAFAESFETLLSCIGEKRNQLRGEGLAV